MDPRQVEGRVEERQQKLWLATGCAIDIGLDSAVWRSGGRLTGVTVNFREYEVLLVIKARFDGKPMVTFISSGAHASAWVQAASRIDKGDCTWKEDEWQAKRDKSD